MAIAPTNEPTSQKPLRLWPGVVAAVLLVLAKFVLPIVVPEAGAFGVLGALVAGLAIVVWWAFFSRAPRSERWGAVVLMIVALFATSRFIHVSIAKGGMGMLFPVLAFPVLSLAFVAWAVASRRLSDGPRRASMVATILVACGAWGLLRTGGIVAGGGSDFHWRWSKTPEERLLAQAADEPAPLRSAPATAKAPEKRLPVQTGDKPMASSSAPAAAKPAADWPGFRGPERDGIVRGVRIKTDWTASPPVELWRRPSSVAGRSDRAGRPSRFTSTASTPRSSAETTRSGPATTRAPASRCGDTATPPDSGSRTADPARVGRRRSATGACIRSARPVS